MHSPQQDPTTELVAQTTAHLERLSARLVHLLAFVPEDKLTWAPSSSARSPLNITAHCALASRFFADIITDGLPEKLPSPEVFFQDLHEAGRKIATRAEAIDLVKSTTTALCTALGTVTAENIETPRRSPFGLLPVRFWMQQGGDHLAGHIGQLEYLQTIWGDLDNHFN